MNSPLRLGDHCTKIGSGATPRGGKASYLDHGPFSLIRSQNVLNDRFSKDGLAYISEEQAQKLDSVEVRSGDVLLNITGDSVARVCQVSNDALPARVNQHVAIIRPDPSTIDPRYLRYFMVTPTFQDFLMSMASSGATRNALTKGMIESFEIPYRPVEEQRAIGSFLGALDDKIELNRRMSATLEEMARALYRSWFVDFDPVHARALGQSPAHMDESTAAIFPDSFGHDGLPNGWKLRRLGEFITLNYGKALKKSLRVPGLFPVYGSGGSDSTHETALVLEPTVIVGRKGTVGSIRWAPNGCWPIDTVFYVSTKMPMTLAYRMLQELPLSDMNTDAAVPGLNRDNAYRLEVAYPGLEVITAFAEQSELWQRRVDALTTESARLAMLRDTLLPRLMSGEFRVREAEQQVEEVL